MSAPPPSLFSRRGGSNKRRIDDCLIDIHNEGVPQLPSCTPELLQPVSLQLSYDNSGILSFRLRVSVVLRDPGITAILLDIPADTIISLSHSPKPRLPERLISEIHPSRARLQLNVPNPAGTLIASSAIKALDPETASDAHALETMRMLSRSDRVVIYLPVGDNLLEYVSPAQVAARPNAAVSSECLLRVANSPAHLDLKTLYGGKGGRIIPPSEVFGHPVIKGDAQDSRAGDDANSPPDAEPPPDARPPPDAEPPPDADLPPSYNDTVPSANPSDATLPSDW